MEPWQEGAFAETGCLFLSGRMEWQGRLDFHFLTFFVSLSVFEYLVHLPPFNHSGTEPAGKGRKEPWSRCEIISFAGKLGSHLFALESGGKGRKTFPFFSFFSYKLTTFGTEGSAENKSIKGENRQVVGKGRAGGYLEQKIPRRELAELAFFGPGGFFFQTKGSAELRGLLTFVSTPFLVISSFSLLECL